MVDDRPAAFVCQNYACQMPATEPQALAEHLPRGNSYGCRNYTQLDTE